MEQRGHIIEVLNQVKDNLDKENYIKIKELSNHFVHLSSVEQDPDIISLAVVIYALSKLIERKEYQDYKNWPEFYKNYIKKIENASVYLKKDDDEKFREEIKLLRESIQNISGNLKNYINEVFRKASINKASRIYEHGISMEKTANILGISLWELTEYAGQARSGDINLTVTLPIKQRIKIAEDIFK
jgi:hypothetical protein